MTWLVIIFFLVLLICLLVSLLVRASRRLLQFDDLLQETLHVLDRYSDDLLKMTSGNIDGTLVDNPEVMGFHARNVRTRLEIQGAVDAISTVSPRRRNVDVNLPRPDVE